MWRIESQVLIQDNSGFIERVFNKAILCSLLCIGIFIGCSAEETVVGTDQPEIVIPETFQQSGHTWTQAEEFSERDQSALENYFRKNPSLAEGALIKGTPSIFKNEKGHRRFYWIGPTATGTQWFMLEFKDKKIKQHEGQGLPFP